MDRGHTFGQCCVIGIDDDHITYYSYGESVPQTERLVRADMVQAVVKIAAEPIAEAVVQAVVQVVPEATVQPGKVRDNIILGRKSGLIAPRNFEAMLYDVYREHEYEMPTKEARHMIMDTTGLTKKQVTAWFSRSARTQGWHV